MPPAHIRWVAGPARRTRGGRAGGGRRPTGRRPVAWAIPDTAPFLLGIDIGTSRTKAVLVDEAGREMATRAGRTPFERGPAGVEAEADRVLRTVAEVVAGLGDGVARVAAVGIAGLAESGVPLDGHGRPLAGIIAWHDPRGAEAVDLVRRHLGDGLAERIGQPLRTVSSVAKLGWLAADGVSGIRRWLGVPEWCLHGLTGACATDFSLAARTGAYDVVAGAPIPEVLDALSLPLDVFPEPVPAGRVMGTVSPAGSRWSGLPAGIAVTVAGHDHVAGLVGAGASEGDLANSVGTAETVLGRTERVPDTAAALRAGAAVTLSPTGEEWVVLASAARAGLVLDRAGRSLGRGGPELDALACGADPVDASSWVAAVAEAVRAGDPTGAEAGDPGDATPPLPEGTPGAVWLGVLDALSARTWSAARRVEAVTGPARRLLVFGGGSRSPAWMEAKARAGHLPVARSPAGEAVARGAAVHAGVAAGWWPGTGAAPPPLPAEV